MIRGEVLIEFWEDLFHKLGGEGPATVEKLETANKEILDALNANIQNEIKTCTQVSVMLDSMIDALKKRESVMMLGKSES